MPYRNKTTGEIISEEEFEIRKQMGLILPTKTPTTSQLATSITQQYKPKKELGEKIQKGLEKVGKFLGMEPLGRGIALTLMRIPGLRRVIAPEVAKLEERVSKGIATPEELKGYIEIFGGPETGGMAPTGRQIVGSAIQTGLLATAPAIPTPTKFLPKVGIGTAIGATTGLARGLMEEKKLTPPELAASTAIGALFGAGMSAILYGLEKGLQKVGRDLYKSIVRYNKDPQKASEVLVKDKIIGTANRLHKKVNARIEEHEELLQSLLKDTPRNITQRRILEEALEQGKLMERPELRRFFNEEAFLKNLETGLEKLGLNIGKKRLNLAEVNALRRQIDRKLGDRAFQKMFDEIPTVKYTLMALRRGLESIVKQEAPETISIFQSYAPYVEASKALVQIVDRASKRMPITFFELAGIGGGMVFPQALPPIIGTILARRGIESGLIPSTLGAITLRGAETSAWLQQPIIQTIIQRALQRNKKTKH